MNCSPTKREAIEIAALAPTARLVALPPLFLRHAVSGEPPGLPTHLRLGTRGGVLLVRFDCRHRGIVATMGRDNEPLWKEDVVEAFLSIEEPPRRYLELEVNPLGARFSAEVDWLGEGEPPSPPTAFGRRFGMAVETFDFPEFTAEVSVRRNRWSALLRVPLVALSARPRGLPPVTPPSAGGEAAIRANFFRIDRASGEHSALFPTRRDPPDFHVPDAFGLFRGHRS